MDLTRITIRVLLPLSVIGGIILLAGGVIDNFTATHVISTLTGGPQNMVGGPVASQEVIKEMGNNGGGFYNANSSHPFENPNPFTNWFEIFLLLVIPFSLARTFGKMVGAEPAGLRDRVGDGDPLASVGRRWSASSRTSTPGSRPAGGGRRDGGQERRVRHTGVVAVRRVHDRDVDRGGELVPRLVHPVRRRASSLFNMMIGEVVPGGVGAGLYGILVLAVVTVFLGGLMVGRTPEYIGKKIRPAEMKYAALYILTTPTCVLVAAGLSLGLRRRRASILNPGAHGLTEIVYAFTSMANNNGSAFAGLDTNTTWYNTVGGIVMLVARFAPMIFALGLAGSLARQQTVPESVGTMPTHKPLFVGMVIGVILIIVGLTYFPALALGPFAEGLH